MIEIKFNGKPQKYIIYIQKIKIKINLKENIIAKSNGL